MVCVISIIVVILRYMYMPQLQHTCISLCTHILSAYGAMFSGMYAYMTCVCMYKCMCVVCVNVYVHECVYDDVCV